jgi:hypothetical protein
MVSQNNLKINIEDKAIKKNFFQLDKIRDRQKRKKKTSTYCAPTGIEIFASIMEQQNKGFLDKIADFKDLTDEDTIMLFKLFWIPSYWIPNPTASIKRE